MCGSIAYAAGLSATGATNAPAARLLDLLRGRDLESLERLPRPLLSEFVVNEI
ncbi:MAG: hypothetical protein AVDCRST_MAG18-4035 [uncultured Thermomicrobiales bacterium]|uniref:Uncharacterized protein n=1 Tax=uncultured Thermomicrobiales bacterium TaxID=1645740 RepID=A0A6J4VS07_9BACT|nr:MAG: hypothetical protein AVDCRST_MAG18-4035 [uncultured Thermomicrobiales bacterium]